jgi:flagellar M-ring protein FliF
MTLVAAALLFFVARPLIAGVFQPPQAVAAPVGDGTMTIPLPGGGSMVVAGTGDPDASNRLEIARIQGTLNAAAMRQVSEVVTDNPEQTVTVIRSWLQEPR